MGALFGAAIALLALSGTGAFLTGEQCELLPTSTVVADATVFVDRISLTRAVANLVDNALKDSDPRGWVTLTLAQAEGRAL